MWYIQHTLAYIIIVSIGIFGFPLGAKAQSIDYSCFQKSGEIQGVPQATIEVSTNSQNNYYFQDDTLLATKYLKTGGKELYSYTINGKPVTDFVWSFDQYDTNKHIIVHFPSQLKRGTFQYDFISNDRGYYFEISQDGQNWYRIDKDLTAYDLDYLKINFQTYTYPQNVVRNTHIHTLQFYKRSENIQLVNSISESPIYVYNNYVCDDTKLSDALQETSKTLYFPIDINTKSFRVQLQNNSLYSPEHIYNQLRRDSDNDGIIDSEDNCPFVYNPDQLDSTASGTGDACSDKDKDGIVGHIDNCPLLYNPDQKDEDQNGIGDACETDSDNDGVYDVLDNCPNVPNPDQKDTDKDGLGDACDNCPNTHNPKQEDLDNDNIGDACDASDDRFVESNKAFFISFIVIIVLIFGVGIYFMMQKLQAIEKK